MVKKKISNEEIFAKLQEIEKLLTKRIPVKRRFEDIVEWKTFIWDGCPEKIERIQENEIDFWCKLLDKHCEFEGCPRNTLD